MWFFSPDSFIFTCDFCSGDSCTVFSHDSFSYDSFIFICDLKKKLFIFTCTFFTIHILYKIFFCLFIYFHLWSFLTLYFYFHMILLYLYMTFLWVIHFSQLITWCHALLEFTCRHFRAKPQGDPMRKHTNTWKICDWSMRDTLGTWTNQISCYNVSAEWIICSCTVIIVSPSLWHWIFSSLFI